jgi:hypothetical protein
MLSIIMPSILSRIDTNNQYRRRGRLLVYRGGGIWTPLRTDAEHASNGSRCAIQMKHQSLMTSRTQSTVTASSSTTNLSLESLPTLAAEPEEISFDNDCDWGYFVDFRDDHEPPLDRTLKRRARKVFDFVSA